MESSHFFLPGCCTFLFLRWHCLGLEFPQENHFLPLDQALLLYACHPRPICLFNISPRPSLFSTLHLFFFFNFLKNYKKSTILFLRTYARHATLPPATPLTSTMQIKNKESEKKKKKVIVQEEEEISIQVQGKQRE